MGVGCLDGSAAVCLDRSGIFESMWPFWVPSSSQIIVISDNHQLAADLHGLCDAEMVIGESAKETLVPFGEADYGTGRGMSQRHD